MSIALAGLAMGFLGSSHCIAMCGGIAGALPSASVPSDTTAGKTVAMTAAATAATKPRLGGVQRSLAYNAGRIASYSVAGAIAGTFGAAFAGLGGDGGMLVLRGLAALLIVATGLYLAGWSGALRHLEVLGGGVWRRIAPMARRARLSDSPLAALAFGAMWGWLPCGLVYSALAVAAASGSTANGALTMAAFGAGTLPATLAIGVFASRGIGMLRMHGGRRIAGAAMIAFGLWTLTAAASTALPAADGVPACHSAAR